MEQIRKELDKEFLNSYYKDMVNEVGEIFQLFLEETPADIEFVTNNFAELKYKEVAEGLHKIAPCFYNVGLPQLTTKVQKIEAAVHAGNHAESLSMFQEFKIELDEYIPAIKEEHQRLMTFQ
jgi:HPt (histidine-containing phosphotransfer) domain-containing protein